MLICYISFVKTAEPYRYTVCLKHDGSDGTHETSCFPGFYLSARVRSVTQKTAKDGTLAVRSHRVSVTCFAGG